MKKIAALLARLLALSILASPFSIWAATATVNGYTWTYQINDNTATISCVSPATGAVTIPSTLGGKPVVCIQSYAFDYCSGLTSVTIPDSVQYIASSAFKGCSGLTSVTIPNSVIVIGAETFAYCRGLTTVSIPDSVQYIASSAFKDCSGLTSVTIPNSVTSIEQEAFAFCSSLTSVTIGNSVTNIGTVAFRGCGGLNQFIVAADNPAYKSVSGLLLTKDGKTLERGVNGAVVIPDSVTGIRWYAFDGCSGLKSVTIPNSVTSIGSSAFSGCSGLTSVTIPDGVTSIGSSAFSGCSGLTSVTIPDGVTSIGSSAFRGCSELSKVKWRNVKHIGESAFKGCNQIRSISFSDGLETIGAEAFKGCDLDEVFLAKSVREIGHGAFYGCGELAELVIGENIEDIGAGTFAENRNLQIVKFRGKPPACIGRSIGYGGGAVQINAAKSQTTDGNYSDEGNKRPSTSNGDSSFYDYLLSLRRSYPDEMIFIAASTYHLASDYVRPKMAFEVTPSAVGYYRKRYSPEWEAVLDDDGKWQGIKMYELPNDEIVITLDANGGELYTRHLLVANGSSLARNLPVPTRAGYRFMGWYTDSSGGEIVVPGVVLRRDVTYYAHWTKNAGAGGGSEPGSYDTPLDEGDITAPYTAGRPITLYGTIYNGDEVVGIVELKLGKVNAKKKTGKISGSFTKLDGKKVSIKAVTVSGIDGASPATVSLNVKGVGTMAVTVGGSQFAGSLGSYHVQSAKVGGGWTGAGTKVYVDAAGIPDGTLAGLLPLEEPVSVAGGRWKFAKAAGVKWTKPKKGAAQPEIYDAASGKGLVVDTSKGKTNLSGLKLTYNPKKGMFKGAFKMYVLTGSGKATKLKKYTVKVSGVVVDGVGSGEATLKKPSLRWRVTVE